MSKGIEKNEFMNTRGDVMPLLPYPFYSLGRHKCNCGKKFWKFHNLQAHYALEHIVLGEKEL